MLPPIPLCVTKYFKQKNAKQPSHVQAEGRHQRPPFFKLAVNLSTFYVKCAYACKIDVLYKLVRREIYRLSCSFWLEILYTFTIPFLNISSKKIIRNILWIFMLIAGVSRVCFHRSEIWRIVFEWSVIMCVILYLLM